MGHFVLHIDWISSVTCEQCSVFESPEIAGPSALVINERPGVRYLCCDRFFKCGERSLVTPSNFSNTSSKCDHFSVKNGKLNYK